MSVEVLVIHPDLQKKQSERLIWLDSLRLMAGVSMVGLHATSDSLGKPFAQFDQMERVAPMLLRAVIYTARTELFLIISIFLLLMALEKRPKSYADTIKIQARRLLIPFLFWTVFYAFYNLIKANAFGYETAIFDALTSPYEWVRYVVLGTAKYHMHFIPTLFGLVLMYPLFKIAEKYPLLGFLVLLCLLVKRDLDGFVFQTFWGTEVLSFAIRIVKILTYAGYGLMAGAFLGCWRMTSPTMRAQFVPLTLFLGGLLFSIKLVATWKTVDTGAWPFEYTAGFYADFMMPVLLFAIAMCLAHMNWPPVLTRLAPYSFGIYLCHPIFLDLAEIWLNERQLSPISQVGVKITFAITMTSVLVVVLERSKLLAWTVGLGALPRLLPKVWRTKRGQV